MPILINHYWSLLVVRHLFDAMERDFCVPCSACRRVSKSASSHTTASEYWARLNLLLMTFRATLRLLSSPQRTASSLSTSMTLLKASVTLIMPCAHGASKTAMTTLSADSPAFSARKSSGHCYSTEGHRLGTPLAHPVVQPEHTSEANITWRGNSIVNLTATTPPQTPREETTAVAAPPSSTHFGA